MQITLHVISEKANRREIVTHLPATIGRSREATLTIAHPMISRKHCELFEQDGWLAVRDLGSLNGTVIDDEQVDQRVVRPGEKFTVGPVTFQAEYKAPDDSPSLDQTPEVALAAIMPEVVEEDGAPPLDVIAIDEAGVVDLADAADAVEPIILGEAEIADANIADAGIVEAGIVEAEVIGAEVVEADEAPNLSGEDGLVMLQESDMVMPGNQPAESSGPNLPPAANLNLDNDLDDFLKGFSG